MAANTAPGEAAYVLSKALTRRRLSRRADAIRPIGRNYVSSGSFVTGVVGTDNSATGRSFYTTKGPVTNLRLWFGLQSQSGGAETAPAGDRFAAATLEYPTGSIVNRFTFGGQIEGQLKANSQGIWSDVLGVYIPEATSFAVRTYKFVAAPPSSPAVSALAGGGFLTASTTYYYWVTSVYQGAESGVGTEISLTTDGSGTQRAKLTWTSAVNTDEYRIYRATSSGSTNARYLGSVSAPRTTFVDDGAASTVSSISPPSQIAINFTRNATTSESGNSKYAGGAGTDVTNSTGAITGVTGPANIGIVLPDVVCGNDADNVAIACIGDSIPSGTGISTRLTGVNALNRANWFDQGFTDGQISSVNFSIPSSTIRSLRDQNKRSNQRLEIMSLGDYVLCALGVNDLVEPTAWTDIATYHLNIAKVCYYRGQRYIISCLVPRLQSTADINLTTAGQTQTAYEADRVSFNTWVRNGCQVNGSGAPVTSGGTPSPFIWGQFDPTPNIEVNASNVLTQDGGYWRVPTSAAFTGKIITTVGGLTSLTCAAGGFTAYSGNSAVRGLIDYVIKMTSGPAVGQVAHINLNTSTVLTLTANNANGPGGLPVAGLTTLPNIGDTFDIYEPYCIDTVHPTLLGHTVIGLDWAAYVSGNVVKF